MRLARPQDLAGSEGHRSGQRQGPGIGGRGRREGRSTPTQSASASIRRGRIHAASPAPPLQGPETASYCIPRG